MSGTVTREVILDAAERLFGERGVESTSLRQLTAAAEVNLAAVHYHFGSKAALLEAVLARRLEPLNRERVARLAELQAGARSAGEPMRLEDLLEAFIAPALRLAGDPGGPSFLRLLGRLHTEPTESSVQRLFLAQFDEVRERFVPLLADALPALPRAELYWRTHFLIGAMAHTMSCSCTIGLLSAGACDPGDTGANTARLVAFAAAGLRAPLPRRTAERTAR